VGDGIGNRLSRTVILGLWMSEGGEPATGVRELRGDLDGCL